MNSGTKSRKESLESAASVKPIKISSSENEATRSQAVELLIMFFQLLGGKPLLREYECEKGIVDLIVKHSGKLYFIGISRPNLDYVKAVAEYYLHRYGIRGIEYDVVSL